jgi:hypothetical protein
VGGTYDEDARADLVLRQRFGENTKRPALYCERSHQAKGATRLCGLETVPAQGQDT